MKSCDASDFAIGAVLGQRQDKLFRAIYYASRTLNEAQLNYTTTEKEMLDVVFACDKFRSYLIGTKARECSLIMQHFIICLVRRMLSLG